MADSAAEKYELEEHSSEEKTLTTPEADKELTSEGRRADHLEEKGGAYGINDNSSEGREVVSSERKGFDAPKEGTSGTNGNPSVETKRVASGRQISDTSGEELEASRESFWKNLAISIISGHRGIQNTENMLNDLQTEIEKKQPNCKSILNKFSTKSYEISKCPGVTDVEEVSAGKGLTFLHLAVICLPDDEQGARTVQKMIALEPSVIHSRHNEGKGFSGPTAFHMAIVKGRTLIAKQMLESFLGQENKLLDYEVDTPLMYGTPLMGLLPLNIAALTFNKKMFDLLVDRGASLASRNSKMESVFHSLVRYAACQPEKEEDVITMIKYIIENHLKNTKSSGAGRTRDDKTFMKSILMMENSKGETILRMGARSGLKKLFEFVINIPGLYKIEMSHDRVNEICYYDITELDKLALMTSRHQSKVSVVTDEETRRRHEERNYDTNKPTSVLENICLLPLERAVDMATAHVLQNVINEYWIWYKVPYALFAIFHLIVMCLTTAGTVIGESTDDTRFVDIINILSFILPFPYFIMEFVRLFISRQPYSLSRLHHNGLTRLLFLLFSVCLLIHACWNRISPWNNYMAIPALIIGWWCMTSFLRGLEKFNYVIVTLYKIIFSDFLSFLFFFLLLLVAFSAAIMAAFPRSVDEFSDYGRILLTMLKLAIVPQDVSDLSANATTPFLAVVLFILYLMSAYLILLNSLVGTFASVMSGMTKDVKGQVLLQKLSASIFMEGVLPTRMKLRLRNKTKDKQLLWHTKRDGGDQKTHLFFKMVSVSD